MVKKEQPKKKPEPKPDEPITIEYKDMLKSNKKITILINPSQESIVVYNAKINGGPITIIKIDNLNKFRYIKLYRNTKTYINIESSAGTPFCEQYNIYDIHFIKTIIIPENEKIVYNTWFTPEGQKQYDPNGPIIESTNNTNDDSEKEKEEEKETDKGKGKGKDDSKPEESSFWTFLMDYSGVFLIIILLVIFSGFGYLIYKEANGYINLNS